MTSRKKGSVMLKNYDHDNAKPACLNLRKSDLETCGRRRQRACWEKAHVAASAPGEDGISGNLGDT